MTAGVAFQPVAFQPVGYEAGFPLFVFGRCDLRIVSQLPYQPVRACFVEDTACEAIATYFDRTGSPGVPSAVSYRLLERTSQVVISDWTAITPGMTNSILIPSEDNIVLNAVAVAEAHELQLQITDVFGNVMYKSVVYDLLRHIGIDIPFTPVYSGGFQPTAYEPGGFQTDPTANGP